MNKGFNYCTNISGFSRCIEANADFIAVTSRVHKANDFIEVGLTEGLIFADINDAKNKIIASAGCR